jgi:hypothetical protein
MYSSFKRGAFLVLLTMLGVGLFVSPFANQPLQDQSPGMVLTADNLTSENQFVPCEYLFSLSPFSDCKNHEQKFDQVIPVNVTYIEIYGEESRPVFNSLYTKKSRMNTAYFGMCGMSPGQIVGSYSLVNTVGVDGAGKRLIRAV